LFALRDEIVLGHPRLMLRTLAVQREFEERLAVGLASLRGLSAPDSPARLEAGVGMVVLRAAVRGWRAEGASSLVVDVRLRLAELRELVRNFWDPSASPK
jgi:hypothetical protein